MMRARRCTGIPRVQRVIGEVISDDMHLYTSRRASCGARCGLSGSEGFENPDGAGETDDAAS